MDKIYEIHLPKTCLLLYEEIKAIPFYKTHTGYRYASYLLENEERDTVISKFLNQEYEYCPDFLNEDCFKQTQSLVRDTIEALLKVTVSDNAFSAWMTFQKDIEGVAEYHRLLEQLFNRMYEIHFQSLIKPQDENDIVEVENSENRSVRINVLENETVVCIDLAESWDTYQSKKQPISNGMALNRNNPFADISIKDQAFIYGSVMGQFEKIGLSTSHTMTSVPKDMEKSYLVLQPGFKIKKIKNQGTGKNAEVLFDDTITTAYEEDNNIYVYIQ